MKLRYDRGMKTATPQMSIDTLLLCHTPQEWVAQAIENQEILLIDHAHCEKKAASSALAMIYRYPDRVELLQKMSRLAREELRHFEQVLRFISARGFIYDYLSPSRYANGLKDHCRKTRLECLIDTLIIGAFIEARSCERFAAVAPHLDEELGKFYTGLLASEARHFQDYLQLAERYSKEDMSERIQFFAVIEAELISSPDTEFRFHSGVPTL